MNIVKKILYTVLLAFITLSCFALATIAEPADVLAKTEDLIKDKQYLKAFELLNDYDKENTQPAVVIKKTELALDYFVLSIMHQSFAFKDLKNSEDIMDYRGKEGSYSYFLFKPNKELEKLIKQYPENWQLYKVLGRYYLEVMFKYSDNWLLSNEELLKKARENYLTAYAHNVYDYQSLFNLGYIELFRQEPQEAIKYFKKSIKLNDNYSASQYNLGYAYFTTGQENTAIPYLKKSYTLYLQEKDNAYAADTARLLTMIYAKSGNSQEAIKYYEQSRNLNIDYAGQKYLLNNVLQNKNNPALCEYIATDFWQLDPDNPTIYDDLLSAYFDAGLTNDLIKLFDKLAEKNQNELKYLAPIYFYRGKLELNLEHKDLAKDYFAKAKEKFLVLDAKHPALKAIDEVWSELQ